MIPCTPDCGYCGRCDDNEPLPSFRCAYCSMPCEDDTYYPYCDPICAVDAEQDSQEDNSMIGILLIFYSLLFGAFIGLKLR
mgnify:CR=1 FL=1